jgi:glucuronoarabinoxylan endo-1,4-beta-xylanase
MSLLRSALVLFVLLTFHFLSHAQPLTYVIDRFDPSGTGGNVYSSGQIGNVWGNWFGNAFQLLAWDSTSDANTNAASGSMKVAVNFNGQGGIPNQFVVYDGFNGIVPPLNGLQYTNFQCDVRFLKGSATNNNTFGSLQFGIAVGSSQDYFGGVNVPSSNTNWVHVSINLNAATDPNLEDINDVLLHIYGPSMSGTSTFWVDNIQFTGPPIATNGQCTVDWNDVHQRIDGFGASSAWDGNTWSAAEADLFFSTNNGCGLSLLRSRIAPNGTTVESSIMQMAQARGARVWSTPWSPPIIYKDTNSVNGGDFVSSPANYQGYANQLAGYVASMKNTYGVNLYAVSVQNEPDVAQTYESCLWTSQQIHDFVPYLSSALSNNNVASTKIMLAEDEGWQWNLAATAMNDIVTSNLVGVLAAHNYGSSATPVTQFGNPCPKPLWETEHYFGADDSITNGVALAQEIYSFMTLAQANAYHYWWLEGSGTGSLVGDSWTTPAKRIFVMGNFSRFVRPNFYRIGLTTNATPTSISAYKDSASPGFAIVAINPNTVAISQTFQLTNGIITSSVTPWITSSNLSLAAQSAVGVTNSIFTYALPAMSVVTFVGQAGLAPTNILLSNASVAENLPVGTVVGTLSALDPDAGSIFTYSLVSGTGSTDNNSFTVAGNTLQTAATFDYETKNSYSIRVRSTDQTGLFTEKVFAIAITDANDAPVLSPVADQTINAGVTLVLTNVATDQDNPPQTLTFSLLNAPTNALLTTSNGVFIWRPLVSQAGTTNLIAIQVADNGTPNLSATNSFNVIVNPLVQPVLGSITLAGGQVSLVVNGAQGPDYTLLTSTNLTGWQALFTTNSPPMPFTFMDTNLTDPARFYRIQIGP